MTVICGLPDVSARELRSHLRRVFELLAHALELRACLRELHIGILQFLKKLDLALIIEPLKLPCEIILLLAHLHQLRRDLQLARG